MRTEPLHSTSANSYLICSDKQYEQDINTNNPLGMNGAMAEVIADVMRKLWCETPRSFAPAKFRVRFCTCIRVTKLPRPVVSEGTFRCSNQAATCPSRTVEASHCHPI